jgi:hypothetical protein
LIAAIDNDQLELFKHKCKLDKEEMLTMTADKTENLEAQAQSIPVKTSRAWFVFLAITVAVLFMLWFESNSKSSVNGLVENDNLLLNGDANTIGAYVVIDGKNVGVMTKSNEAGVDGCALRTHLADGKHVIEVAKQGFDSFRKEIDLQRQAYVGIELKNNPGGN